MDVKGFTDEQLRDFIPDVYCKDIWQIDYQKLWDEGINFLSFDIDDTIAPLTRNKPSKMVRYLFAKLEKMGFKVVLLSNTFDARVESFSKALSIPAISRAEKPSSSHFKKMMDEYKVNAKQMAHIGNSIINDVAGANILDITSCKVRSMGKLANPKKLLHLTDGQKIKRELSERGLWHNHHVHEDDDQYYQFKEIPEYRENAAN